MEVLLSHGPNTYNVRGGHDSYNPDCPEYPTTTIVITPTTEKVDESTSTTSSSSTSTTSTELPHETMPSVPSTTIPVELIPPLIIERVPSTTTTIEVVTPHQPVSELAETGVDSLPLVGFGIGVIALGIAARRAAKRNR